MRLLAAAIVFTVVLVVGFGAGMATQQPLPMIGAFCLWTPAAWFLGFAVHRSLEVNIKVREDYTPIRSNNGREKRPQRDREVYQ